MCDAPTRVFNKIKLVARNLHDVHFYQGYPDTECYLVYLYQKYGPFLIGCPTFMGSDTWRAGLRDGGC